MGCYEVETVEPCSTSRARPSCCSATPCTMYHVAAGPGNPPCGTELTSASRQKVTTCLLRQILFLAATWPQVLVWEICNYAHLNSILGKGFLIANIGSSAPADTTCQYIAMPIRQVGAACRPNDSSVASTARCRATAGVRGALQFARRTIIMQVFARIQWQRYVAPNW